MKRDSIDYSLSSMLPNYSDPKRSYPLEVMKKGTKDKYLILFKYKQGQDKPNAIELSTGKQTTIKTTNSLKKGYLYYKTWELD